jgi:hypothetical protein
LELVTGLKIQTGHRINHNKQVCVQQRKRYKHLVFQASGTERIKLSDFKLYSVTGVDPVNRLFSGMLSSPMLILSSQFANRRSQSKAYVCGRALAGIAGSNPSGVHGCLSLVSVCVVR